MITTSTNLDVDERDTIQKPWWVGEGSISDVVAGAGCAVIELAQDEEEDEEFEDDFMDDDDELDDEDDEFEDDDEEDDDDEDEFDFDDDE